MKIIYNNTHHTIRYFLILLISYALILFSNAGDCTAQTIKRDIDLSFLKSNDSIKSNSLYFNILKAINNTPKVITGSISFQCPENWKIIAFPTNEITLNPGDSAFIPVHLSVASNAIGGIAYILSATLRTNERMLSCNTYISLPSITSWDFMTSKNSIYFNENSPNSIFQVKLTNKGNTNELIKLEFKMGKLLMFSNGNLDDYTEYIDLPAFKDTIISQSVTYKKKLNYADKTRYERNWKESAITIRASNEKNEKIISVMVRKLNSTFANERAGHSSPLNIDYQTYNLMSSQQPRSNLKLFGTLLFPKKREIQYIIGAHNLYYNKSLNKDFNIDNQLVYSLRYSDKRNRIEIGYNINGGSLHSINGRGLNGTFSFNPITRLYYALTQNPYTQNVGGFLGTSFSVKRFSINTEFTHENHVSGSYSANSGALGVSIPLFKHQTLSVQGLVSQVKNNLQPGIDTTVIGYSYKVDYNMNYKKFNLQLSALNSANNYVQNAGQQQIYLDSKYIVSEKVRISLYGNRQNYATSHYPYNLVTPRAYNSTDYLRFTTSISNGNITYQLGPSYSGSMRHNYNPITNYFSEYVTYQPGIWASASVRVNNYGVISPNLTVSNLRFYYNTKDPALQSYSIVNNIYYSVGLNYYDNIWRGNISYISGSTSDIYRSVQIDSDPITSKSIQFRPSYENYFFARKLKLSAFVNYAYYMPSGRENVSYNVKSDIFLKKGWTAYVSGFMYSNTRVNEEQGRITTKDLNFVVGITKSFNIQQPRLKYYHLKSVFFNDLDGNGVKTDNEPPVSNILVNIAKDQSVKSEASTIPELELLSDVNGEISYENLPKDNYKFRFMPLTNLQNLYFINGANQSYFNDKNRVQYIPLAESYRVKGKIILVRDQNSLEGKIDLKGIRITATGEKGETFSALTDNYGAYVLTVSTANKYKIHINNVFGELFSIDTNEMEVQFAQSKAINLDFTFFEKRRDVQFENGNEIFKFKSISGLSESQINTANSPEGQKQTAVLKTVPKSTVTAPVSYAIQLGVSKTYPNSVFYASATKLKSELLYMNQNGVYKYYTGTYGTIEAAKKDIAKSGIKGLIAIAVDRSLLKTVEQIVATTATYSVQLDVLKTYRDPAFYKDKFKLTDEVLYVEGNGEFKYYVGKYKTIEDAKIDISKFGMSGFPVIVDLKTLKSAPITAIVTVYSIQLDVLKTYREPTFYKEKYKLPEDVLYSEKDGEFKYFYGSYNTPESAKGDISTFGLAGFPVAIDKSNLKKSISKDKITITSDSMAVYSIQLDVLKTYRDPSFYKDKFNLNEDVLFSENEGEFKYYFGSYKSADDAKLAITKFGLTGFPVTVDLTILKKGIISNNSSTYSIQLDVLKIYRDPLFYKDKFKLKDEVLILEDNGKFKYFVGNYNTKEEAKADKVKLGLTGFPIEVNRKLLKKASEISEIQKENPEVKDLFEKALQGIQFETENDIIKKSSYSLLNKITSLLIENSNYKVEINVHTDNKGDASKNIELSQKQSDAIKKYLADKGVELGRLTAKGLGASIPIADNTNEKEQIKNRRVELKIKY